MSISRLIAEQLAVLAPYKSASSLHSIYKILIRNISRMLSNCWKTKFEQLLAAIIIPYLVPSLRCHNFNSQCGTTRQKFCFTRPSCLIATRETKKGAKKGTFRYCMQILTTLSVPHCDRPPPDSCMPPFTSRDKHPHSSPCSAVSLQRCKICQHHTLPEAYCVLFGEFHYMQFNQLNSVRQRFSRASDLSHIRVSIKTWERNEQSAL